MARQRKCKIGEPGCHGTYTPFNSLQKSCPNPKCAIAAGKSLKAKQHRKELREFREKTKSRSQWVKEAQTAFNRFIRLRDHGQPCICCGQYATKENSVGGTYDCGHYLSVGSHPELRFTEDNAHLQLKSCNAGSGKYTRKNYTVQQEYRERLIKKIGLSRVEWLEGPHPAAKWTIDELKGIKEHYNKLANDMQKRIENGLA